MCITTLSMADFFHWSAAFSPERQTRWTPNTLNRSDVYESGDVLMYQPITLPFRPFVHTSKRWKMIFTILRFLESFQQTMIFTIFLYLRWAVLTTNSDALMNTRQQLPDSDWRPLSACNVHKAANLTADALSSEAIFSTKFHIRVNRKRFELIEPMNALLSGRARRRIITPARQPPIWFRVNTVNRLLTIRIRWPLIVKNR